MRTQASPTSRLAASLLLLGVTVVWGWTFVVVKESLQEVDTFTFLFYRFALAWLLLLAFVGPRLRPRAVEPRVWGRGALIGLTLFLGFWFQTWGLHYTTATHSAFITGLSVVLVPVLGVLLFRERVTAAAWLGAALSTVGLALIVFGASPPSALEPGAGVRVNLGDVLTFFGAVSFALQILLVGRFARPQDVQPLLLAQIGVVALLSALGMAIFEGVTWPRAPVVWKGIVVTGVLATAGALWVQVRFQPLVSATGAAVIFAGEPVFAALFGYALLGERLVGAQWPGALLILTAMLVAQWPTRRRVDEVLARRRPTPAGAQAQAQAQAQTQAQTGAGASAPAGTSRAKPS